MPASPIPRLALVLPFAWLVFPAASPADRVILANGRVLDDVVAVAREQGVEIRMGGGTMTLPLSAVRALESSSATLSEYRDRATTLAANGAATAAEWLELARWARAREFGFGVREAALTAAAMAPELPGLEAILRELGYELDPGTGRWLPLDEAMRARGWVEDQGDWVPAEVAARRAEERRSREEARRREAEAARLERLTAALEAQALAHAAQPEQPAYWGWPAYGYGSWGGVHRPPHDGRPERPHVNPVRQAPPAAQPLPPAPHSTSRPPAR